jgi:hypothetical protein
MGTYLQPGIYSTSTDYSLYWGEQSLSATTDSDSSTSDRFKVYLDVLSDKVILDNHVDVSKEKIEELIVEALGMMKRQKYDPIIEFTDEEFEL